MTTRRCPLCRSESSREEFRKKSFHYHRCQACRHVFVHPLPAEEENRAYYDLIHTAEYLEESRDWFQLLARKRMDLLSDVTGDLSPIRLLDVGSGHGFFLAEARQRGWDALGIEVSAQPRQFAKRELGLDVVGEDIERSWPRLGDREFDVITFWHVLEHLERPDEVLLEAVSRLGRGGVLVLNSPNLASAIYRFVGRHWSWIYTPGHLQYFSPAALRDWLGKAGVEIVQSETWTDAPNLYFLFEEAILLRIKDRLEKSKRRSFRLKGNRLSQYLAGERHKIAMQYRLARWYERTPLLDSFLKKRDLGHEFLIIARKPAWRVPRSRMRRQGVRPV